MLVNRIYKHMQNGSHPDQCCYCPLWASLVVQVVQNLPARQETQVQSLGQEDPLEKEMATTPVFLPGKIPWTEEPGGLQCMESQRVGHD